MSVNGMSALGQKRTFASQKVMSALPSKADMCGAAWDVRFGPKADMGLCRSERAYSGARALRSGMSEILIRPLNGSFISKIK